VEFLRQTATADVVSNRIGFVPRSSSVNVNGFLDCSRREDAMSMHERWSGEYEYDIEVLPLVPPMSNGYSHEAKVARFDRRQRSSRLDSVSPLSFGLRRAKTEAEAVQMVEADVETWISEH
jgi:hypothetical protein